MKSPVSMPKLRCVQACDGNESHNTGNVGFKCKPECPSSTSCDLESSTVCLFLSISIFTFPSFEMEFSPFLSSLVWPIPTHYLTLPIKNQLPANDEGTNVFPPSQPLHVFAAVHTVTQSSVTHSEGSVIGPLLHT